MKTRYFITKRQYSHMVVININLKKSLVSVYSLRCDKNLCSAISDPNNKLMALYVYWMIKRTNSFSSRLSLYLYTDGIDYIYCPEKQNLPSMCSIDKLPYDDDSKQDLRDDMENKGFKIAIQKHFNDFFKTYDLDGN